MKPINKIEGRVSIPKSLKKHINKLKPYKGGEWDLKTPQLAELKVRLRVQLKKIQGNRCAYCGLKFDETSNSEIEHIAPKGGAIRPKYTKFVFIPYNLVLACHLCNSPVKKGRHDTINQLEINYKLCDFNIVHPYFDDPDDHYDWVPAGGEILISKKTIKGENSIRLFDLDGSAHSEARAKLLLYAAHREHPDAMEQQLKDILNYK